MVTDSHLPARTIDPRVRRYLSSLTPGRHAEPANPAHSTLYWLVRARRPRSTALAGRPPETALLTLACALAENQRALLVWQPRDDSDIEMLDTLSKAGLEWLMRRERCAGCDGHCARLDCLVVCPDAGSLDDYAGRLTRGAMVIGIVPGCWGQAARALAARLADAFPIETPTCLQAGPCCLLLGMTQDR
ncbi:MAG: hypothetical protein HND55_02170 [Pseudomonadota bacterium]|nr:MAG: hypothetical protein HND55_02170 [Pseudomonadota bacterium]